jgi:hypothetical protein
MMSKAPSLCISSDYLHGPLGPVSTRDISPAEQLLQTLGSASSSRRYLEFCDVRHDQIPRSPAWAI